MKTFALVLAGLMAIAIAAPAQAATVMAEKAPSIGDVMPSGEYGPLHQRPD